MRLFGLTLLSVRTHSENVPYLLGQMSGLVGQYCTEYFAHPVIIDNRQIIKKKACSIESIFLHLQTIKNSKVMEDILAKLEDP